MISQSFFKQTLGLTLSALFPAGFLAVMLPSGSAQAFNQFDVCIEQMVGSGVAKQQATTACADALIPRELSQCVRQIRSNLNLPPDAVLQNCYRVRRPIDLANCVVDINRRMPFSTKTTKENEAQAESLPMMVLESCRKSLLPGRYSECVTAANQSGQNSPEQALQTCLSAEDFPRDIFPSYLDN